MSGHAGARPVPTLSVPDIRDYERINAELAAVLDQGEARVRLVGAEGQRLLAAGLAGAWDAIVEIEGRAGPELAAGLNAPRLTVVCHGPAADGAGRALRAGTLIIAGDVGPALGYALEDGTLVVAGRATARAGLNQKGGVIVVLGTLGALAGERQAGGLFCARGDGLGPHAGHGARGGRFVRLGPLGNVLAGVGPEDAALLRGVFESSRHWIGPGDLPPA